MTPARSRTTVDHGLRQILSQNGEVLFDEVIVFSNSRTGVNGGTARGYFVVTTAEPMPNLFGQTITVSGEDGSMTCAVVTHVAGYIVQFRTAGPNRS